MSDNDHLSCIGEPAQLGDGPALYMRPEDDAGTVRFWPSGEVAALLPWFPPVDPERIDGTPYEAYQRLDDLPGTFRIRMAETVLHARLAHPEFEYHNTRGPRKAWYDYDVPPEGVGWERNVDAGENGWDRFDFYEVSYWRRRRA